MKKFTLRYRVLQSRSFVKWVIKGSMEYPSSYSFLSADLTERPI